jgi:hypothetical protein
MGLKTNMAMGLGSRLIEGQPNIVSVDVKSFLHDENAQGIVCTVTYTLHSSTVVL